jgi:radical SAM protein with 4Fe4S-binding SPASM domain
MRAEDVPVIFDHVKVAETITSDGSIQFTSSSADNRHLRLNEDTFKLLSLCDGTRSVSEILGILLEEYEEPVTMKEKVTQALLKLERNGILYFSKERQKAKHKIVSVRLSHPINEAFLEITNKCNLKCPHCYGNFGPESEELETAEWMRAIDELADLNVNQVILSGGEPLCHKDVLELVSYIRKKPMQVVLSTNGTLIDERIADEIKQLSVKSVRISLDGPNAQVHDGFRGVTGTYDKVIKAINFLLERNVHVRINSCITKDNLNYLPETIRFIQALGVNEYKFFVVYFTGRETSPMKLFCPNDSKELEYIFKTLGSSITTPEEKTQQTESNEIMNCEVGRNHLVIEPNGNVVPCLVFDRKKFALGNVRKDSVKNIWENSELLNTLRNIDMRNVSECSKCEDLPVCRGGCRARAFTFSSEAYKPDPFACIAHGKFKI